MYALVLEAEGYEFLFDHRNLWKPPTVHVRRGVRQAELWLSDEVTLKRAGGFIPRETDKIVKLVEAHQDDLLTSWWDLKEDVRRGRLDRNTLVE